jgi:hypothetical protein
MCRPLQEGHTPRRLQPRTNANVGEGRNPEAEAVSPGNGSDSAEVPTKVPTPAAADRDLAAVVEAWSSLPPAVRAGILAMVEASR